MRAFQIVLATFVLACMASPLSSAGPCEAQNAHVYGVPGAAGGKGDAVTVLDVATGGAIGLVSVMDTNVDDCDGDGLGGDFDGDYDSGVGGAFFGYGTWAADEDCGHRLHAHGAQVVVNDVVFGAGIRFFVGEDDQDGPLRAQDPEDGSWICMTDGLISPGPDGFPAADADDCLAGLYTGQGRTCGRGGGDGGYWVALVPTRGGNPPTSGIIVAES